MTTTSAATHTAALVVGLVLGATLLSPGPVTAPPAGQHTSTPTPTHPQTAPLPPRSKPDHATTPTLPDTTHPGDELERRYDLFRQLTKDGRTLDLSIDPNAFNLSPDTSEFFGLSPSQVSAIQAALDDTVAAIRELESANSETIADGSIAVGDLAAYTPALEADLREKLAAILPADDLDLLDSTIGSLFEPLTSVREISVTLDDKSGSFTVNHSNLGDNGVPVNSSSVSGHYNSDPSRWRQASTPLWRYYHLFPTTP